MPKIDFTDEQNEFINADSNKNIILKACAGSGKSSCIIERVKKQRSYKMKEKCMKIDIILTFTNKSRNDLEKKLDLISLPKSLTTTFHGFIISEILSFSNKIDTSTPLSIDYNKKFWNIDDWSNYLNKFNIIASSGDSKRDYTLMYGIEIFKNNKSCREYIKTKYDTIYIDEAQDNNMLQYKLIKLFIAEGIKIVLVGDVNQTIFSFRGASKKMFEEMCYNDIFLEYTFTKNFRCNEIINEVALQGKFPDTPVTEDFEWFSEGVFLIDSINYYNLLYSLPDFAILRRMWPDEKSESNYNNVSMYEKHKIKITKYPIIIDQSSNPGFLAILLDEYFNSKNEYNVLRENNLSITKKNFSYLNQFFKTKNVLHIKHLLDNLEDELKIKVLNDYDINLLEKGMKDDKVELYFKTQTSREMYTIHSSKGLEFENVILFRDDFRKNQDLFYMACTRARSRLFIINI